MRTKIPRKFVLALALTPGLAASLLAQTTPAGENNQPVLLETFTVNTDRDRGYIAVDSLAGGRQNTPLRVTPSAVSSLTSEFISDIAATDLQDALRWSLNVIPTNFRSGNMGGNGGETHNFWSVSIRGDAHVQGGNPPTKNYFPTFMIIDTYNVERIEFNSGPNSILFGIGDIGGSLTTYTKQARFDRSFQDLTLRATDFGAYRVAADVNQAIGNLAVRVNAVWADEKGWRDGEFDKRKGVALAATYRFTDNTQLRLEVEGWRQKRNIFANTVTDGFSLWNGNAVSETWGVLPAGAGGDNPVTTPGASGVRTMDAWGGAADYRVYIAGLGVMNWAGGARSTGLNEYYADTFLRDTTWVEGRSGRTVPALPSREFAIAPLDSVLEPESLSASLSFEHRFNENSEIQVQAYKYVDTAQATNFEGAGGGLGYGVAIDLNRQLPNGQSNPNYGKKYSDFFLDKQVQNHRVDEIRAQYSYHFDTTVWDIPLKQSFSVSAGRQETDYDARQYLGADASNYSVANWQPDNWTKTMVWGRVYWDNPHGALGFAENEVIFKPLETAWYDFDSTQKISYAGVFSQTRLWADRLNISLGARRDDYENSKVGIRPRDTTSTRSEDAGNTYSVGVVGYITDWLGIVGNLSSNFQPAAGGLAPGLYGETFGPSEGKGRDVGVRVSTKDHKYYASVNFYETKASDVIGGELPPFQSIWTEYVKAGGTSRDIGPSGTISGLSAAMNFNDTYAVEYEGVEIELVANPTPNIRLKAGYSRPEGVKTDAAPISRRYWADHIDEWQVVAPASSLLRNELANGQRILDATAATSVTSNLPTKMFHVFGSYSFLDGTLEGLELGGGVSALGEQYGNASAFIHGERIKSPAYELYSAYIGYSMNFDAFGRRVKARFQVNVDNVFDEDQLIFTSYQPVGTSGVQGANYRYLTPRRLAFTANFSF